MPAVGASVALQVLLSALPEAPLFGVRPVHPAHCLIACQPLVSVMCICLYMTNTQCYLYWKIIVRRLPF